MPRLSRLLADLAARLRSLLFAAREDRELAEEIRFHIEREIEKNLAAGLSPREARRQAHIKFGGVERMRERAREARGVRQLERLAEDVRHGARSLRKSPGFTLSAMLVLGLGIGASATGLAIVRSVLLRPLPYPEPDRLVRMWPASPERGSSYDPLSLPNYRDWQARSQSFQTMGLYLAPASDWAVELVGRTAEELSTVWVAGDFFGTLAVAPVLGRSLSPEDIEAGRAVAVLSDEAWRRLFAADPSVVGSAVTMDSRSFEVVGIMPPGFGYPEADSELWVPLTTVDARAFPYERRGVSSFAAIGRLDDGRTVEDAGAELARIASDLAEEYPENNAGRTGATVMDLRESIVGEASVALWSLSGAVALFLFLAAINVANLQVARAVGRSREIAVRRGLGAPQARIASLLLTESALITLGGGALGLAVSVGLLHGVTSQAAQLLPRVGGVHLDVAALLGVSAVTLLVTCASSLLPMLREGGVGGFGALRGGRRAMGGDVRAVRARRWLVAGEVALAAVLLTGATLLVRSWEALSSIDPGFEAEGAVAMTISIPYSGDAFLSREWVTTHEEILEELRRLPGVLSAGAIAYLPFRSDGEGIEIQVPGLYEPTRGEGLIARVFPVTTDAFRALGMSLQGGRDFLPSDGASDVRVAVVNEAMVADVFQGRDPIGMRISGSGTEWEVVGVVADVRHGGLEQGAYPAFYTHIPQAPRARQSYVLRTDGDPLALLGPMRSVVQRIDPGVAIAEMLPLSGLTEEDTARPRFLSAVLSGFASLALLLACVGVYGVLAYIVRMRTTEMGLRAALGATGRGIVVHVLGSGLRPALVGLVLGLGASALLTRYLDSLLFGVEPADPLSFLVSAGLLGGAALAACAIPALAAARVTPAAALRSDA